MTFLRPRSLSGLVLLGLAIIALPLVAALVTSGVQMRRLAETSGRIIAEGVLGTRLTQDLFARSAQLERQVRLYQVLDDGKVLEAYATQDARLRDIELQLLNQMRSPTARALVSEYTALREKVSARMLNTAQARLPFDELLTD